MDAHEAQKTYDCKQPGCTNEAKSPVGRYAYCPEHRGQAKKRTDLRAVTTGSVEQKLKSLAADARAVDRAKAKAKQLTEQALAAKAAAETLERDFQRSMRTLLGEDEEGVRVVA